MELDYGIVIKLDSLFKTIENYIELLLIIQKVKLTF